MRITCIALPLLLTGCIITGGNDPQPCDDILLEEAPSIELRDPESGVCTFQGGGGGGSGGTCGDFGGGGNGDAPTTGRAPELFLDWATCYQGCEGLDEQSCLTTSACRAAYIDDGATNFYECWGTAPSGPIQGGACETLDAFRCSQHDDCSAVHGKLEALGDDNGFINALGYFERCMAEPGNQPDTGSCTGEVTCDALNPNCPEGTIAGRRDGCYTGYCIPLDQCEALPACSTLAEDQCVARGDCEGLYQGVDCTCDGDVCSCASWNFDGCEPSL